MGIRSHVLLAALGWACLGTEALAAADLGALNAAKNEIYGVMSDIEGNLVERDAIEMNAKSLEPKANSVKARMDDYNQRIAQHNAYCTGTFEEPEYSRRKAYCDAEAAQLDTLMRQLDIERQGVLEQINELQRRDTARQQKFTALQSRLDPAILHLVTACFTLSLEDQKAHCHMPAAPGPRTREMVANMERALVGGAAGNK